MNPISKLLKALPPGTAMVAGGTAVLGAASYIHLAVAGHSLTKAHMAGVSVLWTLVMSVGIGLFFPIEQELTRIVAARAVSDEGAAPVVRKAALLTGGILAVVLGALALFAGPIADRLFQGDRQLVAVLGAAFAAMALCYLTRGVLAGTRHFTAYGTQLAVDGGLRIAMAFACAAAGLHSALAFSLILVVAPFIALLVTLSPTLRGARPGGPIATGELVRGLGPLTASTLLAQVVVNAAVMSTQLFEPTRTELIAGLLSALVLARVPLFVFGSLQASLLSGLSTVVAGGDHQGFSRMLRKACAVVLGLGAVGGVPAVVIGPWLIEVLFGAAPGQLGHVDFLWFALGTTAYMLAMVLGQAQMVLHKHRAQLVCWVLGTVVLIGITVVPGDIALRVGLAYAIGSLATAGTMLLTLRGAVPRRTAAPVPNGHLTEV
ncbi:lipopolysaccharide biosynthesis protein [Streptomyces sp. NPDC059533]|uniref:lipopolysaccharide biosynthesis protein n=1 Tax=unclassified Streptomyces TaxID=2593676 RepID=UPI00367DF21B